MVKILKISFAKINDKQQRGTLLFLIWTHIRAPIHPLPARRR
jgi:hypothetical protein